MTRVIAREGALVTSTWAKYIGSRTFRNIQDWERHMIWGSLSLLWKEIFFIKCKAKITDEVDTHSKCARNAFHWTNLDLIH